MAMKRIPIALCLVVAACGGEDSEPVAWKDMSFEQRYAYMEEVVTPQMSETFAAFDPKFEGMSCPTCHGAGATDGSYAMPSAEVPPLPDTPDAFLEYAMDPEVGRWADWMYNTVVPQMADLLQVERFDPTTETGEFSCNNCHTLTSVTP
ncbi:hypothetical protein [Sorangium sp. So ce131]|uniref:hypothetical protein n=1 Tax=Sorangium sp. So ce131 TaxID=3133282 RepID=UPI003F60C13A